MERSRYASTPASTSATAGSVFSPPNGPLLDTFRPQDRLPKSMAAPMVERNAGNASPKDEMLSLSSAKREESVFLDTASTGDGTGPRAVLRGPRWAPPAPHLLPPLPPMSYELRCWIQALERAQNGTNGLNPGPSAYCERNQPPNLPLKDEAH
eukprot:symbB.v1.2.032985.t1/scaffold4035.1/size45816/1